MLASCSNCVFSQGNVCTLGQSLAEGELLCSKYSMTIEFRQEILEAMRKDINKEIQAAIMRVRLEEMQKVQFYAG